MSNTPSDDGLFELIKEHFDLDKRPFDTVIDRKTGRFHDAARYRDFASAVLAKWSTPAPVGVESIGYLYCGDSYGDELADWEIVADQCQCDKLNEHYGALGKEAKLPLYTTPQPTQTVQPVVREPLTDAQIAEMMRDTWGCASIAPRHALEFARAVERAHGIAQKGGSNADT